MGCLEIAKTRGGENWRRRLVMGLVLLGVGVMPLTTHAQERNDVDVAAEKVFAKRARLLATPLPERCRLVYRVLYADAEAALPFQLSEAAYLKALQAKPGGVTTPAWHKRYGKAGRAKGPLVRLFVRLRPDHIPTVMHALVNALDKKRQKFSLKVSTTPSKAADRHALVVYANDDDVDAVSAVLFSVLDAHADAVAEGTPLFSRRLRKGVGLGPAVFGKTPSTRAKHSFGTAISGMVCESLSSSTTSSEALADAIRHRFAHYGVDPVAPWQKPTSVQPTLPK